MLFFRMLVLYFMWPNITGRNCVVGADPILISTLQHTNIPIK